MKEHRICFFKKQLVVFYLGAAWERWDETNLTQGGIGGSETAAIWMARSLSDIGYQVKIFADVRENHMDVGKQDVEYLHYSKWEDFAKKHSIDFFISSRTVAPFLSFIPAHKKYVWIHDIYLNPERKLSHVENQIDAYLCLSHWHKDFVHAYHNIPLDKIKITANGVDPSRFSIKLKKQPGQIFYSSSPDRGLDALLYCGDYIQKFVPNLSIMVAYGFSNLEKLVKKTNDLKGIEYVKNIKKALCKPYVKYLGRIDQQMLAKVQLTSCGWFHPTNFNETFCITAVEAGFAHTPILTSKKAGITHTVGDGGILLQEEVYSKEYLHHFISEAVHLLTNPTYNAEWAEKSYHRMKRFTWEAVAMQWHNLFQKNVFEEIQ